MPPPRTIDPSLRQSMRLVDFIGCPTARSAICLQHIAVLVVRKKGYMARYLQGHAGMASGVITAKCQGLMWCSYCGRWG